MADNNVWVNITDLLWPVGSVYTCHTNSQDNSPTNLFGGTWVGPIEGSTYTDTTSGTSFTEYKYFRTATGIEA